MMDKVRMQATVDMYVAGKLVRAGERVDVPAADVCALVAAGRADVLDKSLLKSGPSVTWTAGVAAPGSPSAGWQRRN